MAGLLAFTAAIGMVGDAPRGVRDHFCSDQVARRPGHLVEVYFSAPGRFQCEMLFRGLLMESSSAKYD